MKIVLVGTMALILWLAPALAGAGDVGLCFNREVTIDGWTRGQRLVGTSGPDVIHGGPGPDVLIGRGGRDLLCGGKGGDLIRGDEDNDQLRGGRGGDELRGGRGKDEISGYTGRDELQGGGSDPDWLWGGAGRDFCRISVDDFLARSCAWSGDHPLLASHWTARNAAPLQAG